MLKAGALYYAILVAFLVALLGGFLMMNVWLHHYQTYNLLQGRRLERNVNSALNLAMEVPGTTTLNQAVTVNLFDDENDAVTITKTLWGGYYLLRAKALWQKLEYSAIRMCGTDVFCDEPLALYLADNERYLSISGNTAITGNCYLPKLGIRRAYIEGKSFTGEELVTGKIQTSKSTLPDPDPEFGSAISSYFETSSFSSDSILSISRLIRADTVSNSFRQKTIVFYSTQWININKQVLKGNIKIVSSKGVTIGKGSNVQDVIVYAPKIITEQGVTGALQMFARDTLIIGEGTFLKFPSMVGIIDASAKKPLIDIKDNSRISGDIVLLTSQSNNQAECRINQGCSINGRVYCDGKVQLKGAVYGSIYCKGFILKTQTSVYENHLLDATINFNKLSKFYSGACFFTVSNRFKPIKWLY